MLVADRAHELDLLLQRFKLVGKLGHFVLEVNVVQPHQLQLITAKAQTCDERGHVIDHAVLRQTGVFQLDDALCLAADQARIVDHPCRALDLPHHQHDRHDHADQNGGQHHHQHPRNIGIFLTCLFQNVTSDPQKQFILLYRILSK